MKVYMSLIKQIDKKCDRGSLCFTLTKLSKYDFLAVMPCSVTLPVYSTNRLVGRVTCNTALTAFLSH